MLSFPCKQAAAINIKVCVIYLVTDKNPRKRCRSKKAAPAEHAPTQAETERSGRTVEAGHYVVLTAITSKFIWAPESKKTKNKKVEKTEKKKRGEYTPRKRLL